MLCMYVCMHACATSLDSCFKQIVYFKESVMHNRHHNTVSITFLYHRLWFSHCNMVEASDLILGLSFGV